AGASPGEVHHEKTSSAASSWARAGWRVRELSPSAPMPSAAPPFNMPRREARVVNAFVTFCTENLLVFKVLAGTLAQPARTGPTAGPCSAEEKITKIVSRASSVVLPSAPSVNSLRQEAPFTARPAP